MTSRDARTDVEVLECMSPDDDCSGSVERRMSLSGSGSPTIRCDEHWQRRLNLEADLNRRYPAQRPGDFDPFAAGERWSDDDPWP